SRASPKKDPGGKGIPPGRAFLAGGDWCATRTIDGPASLLLTRPRSSYILVPPSMADQAGANFLPLASSGCQPLPTRRVGQSLHKLKPPVGQGGLRLEWLWEPHSSYKDVLQ